MVSRPIHFELHVDDLDRARDFYSAVFGWGYQDFSEYAGQPYFAIVTGQDEEPGINGALVQRRVPLVDDNPVSAAVLTMEVESFDAVAETILGNGGEVAVPKTALPGLAWQGYFLDPDGNVFGVHQPDESAA